jgi:hypothetical protein
MLYRFFGTQIQSGIEKSDKHKQEGQSITLFIRRRQFSEFMQNDK